MTTQSTGPAGTSRVVRAGGPSGPQPAHGSPARRALQERPQKQRTAVKNKSPHGKLRFARATLLMLSLLAAMAGLLFKAVLSGIFLSAIFLLTTALIDTHLKSRTKQEVRDLPDRHQVPQSRLRAFLWQALLWPVYNVYGWNCALLRPSLNEQISRARQSLEQITDGEDGVHAIVTIANQKGGSGKSSGTASSGCIIADTTGQIVIAVDNNQTKGNTASRLGVKQTLTLRQAISRLGDSFHHDTVIRHLGHHPTYSNLYVVDSDSAAARASSTIDSGQYARFIEQLKRTCHTLIFDCGNNLDSDQTIVAFNLSDVIEFVALSGQENSITDCRDTMEHFRTTHPDKVANSVLVITGHRRGDPDINYYAEFFNHPAEQIVLVPFDSVFVPLGAKRSRSPEQVRVVDHLSFRRRTLLASLRRDILLYEQAGLAQSKAVPQEPAATQPLAFTSTPDEMISSATRSE